MERRIPGQRPHERLSCQSPDQGEPIANPGPAFFWANIRASFGKGGAREFRGAAGDRSLVMPAV